MLWGIVNETLLAEYQELWEDFGLEVPHFSLEVGLEFSDLFFVKDSNSKESETRALLDKMIEAMGYVPNAVPAFTLDPNDPTTLLQKITQERPRFVVALGQQSAQFLLGSTESIESLHGRIVPAYFNPEVRVLPVFSLLHLLENPKSKKIVWDDLQALLKEIRKK